MFTPDTHLMITVLKDGARAIPVSMDNIQTVLGWIEDDSPELEKVSTDVPDWASSAVDELESNGSSWTLLPLLPVKPKLAAGDQTFLAKLGRKHTPPKGITGMLDQIDHELKDHFAELDFADEDAKHSLRYILTLMWAEKTFRQETFAAANSTAEMKTEKQQEKSVHVEPMVLKPESLQHFSSTDHSDRLVFIVGSERAAFAKCLEHMLDGALGLIQKDFVLNLKYQVVCEPTQGEPNEVLICHRGQVIDRLMIPKPDMLDAEAQSAEVLPEPTPELLALLTPEQQLQYQQAYESQQAFMSVPDEFGIEFCQALSEAVFRRAHLLLSYDSVGSWLEEITTFTRKAYEESPWNLYSLTEGLRNLAKSGLIQTGIQETMVEVLPLAPSISANDLEDAILLPWLGAEKVLLKMTPECEAALEAELLNKGSVARHTLTCLEERIYELDGFLVVESRSLAHALRTRRTAYKIIGEEQLPESHYLRNRPNSTLLLETSTYDITALPKAGGAK